jgi:hypothetical protein
MQECDRPKSEIFKFINSELPLDLEKHLSECEDCGNTYVLACYNRDSDKSARFTLRLQTVYSKSDVEKLKSIVDRSGGVWEGAHQVKFLNYKNQYTGQFKFACLYHFDRDIDMEVSS